MTNQLPPLLARVLGREDEFFGRRNDVLSDLVVVLVRQERLGGFIQRLQGLLELLGLLVFISNPSSIGGGSVGWHVVGFHGLAWALDYLVWKMKRGTAERAGLGQFIIVYCALRAELVPCIPCMWLPPTRALVSFSRGSKKCDQ